MSLIVKSHTDRLRLVFKQNAVLSRIHTAQLGDCCTNLLPANVFKEYLAARQELSLHVQQVHLSFCEGLKHT